AEEVAEACRQLVRIGIDEIAGAAVGEAGKLAGERPSGYPVATFADLPAVFDRPGAVVLDVRRPDEWDHGHLEGARHVPFWQLTDRLGEVPDGQVWVHCASGFRASIGASILDRAGRDVVLVDDDWERAAELGLPMAGAASR
ncbi:MAG: rhodanese-like domain-containing protein, partial [Acidimicrobiales bacterium]